MRIWKLRAVFYLGQSGDSKTCCRRAFIRGAFLAAGSISDPQKFYHFEIVCATVHKAVQLQEIMNDFGVDAKIVQRKSIL